MFLREKIPLAYILKKHVHNPGSSRGPVGSVQPACPPGSARSLPSALTGTAGQPRSIKLTGSGIEGGPKDQHLSVALSLSLCVHVYVHSLVCFCVRVCTFLRAFTLVSFLPLSLYAWECSARLTRHQASSPQLSQSWLSTLLSQLAIWGSSPHAISPAFPNAVGHSLIITRARQSHTQG